MLHVVSLIRPVNSTIERKINNMAAKINIKESKIFKEIFDEGEASGEFKQALSMALLICERREFPLDKNRIIQLSGLSLEELSDFSMLALDEGFEEAFFRACDNRSNYNT